MNSLPNEQIVIGHNNTCWNFSRLSFPLSLSLQTKSHRTDYTVNACIKPIRKCTTPIQIEIREKVLINYPLLGYSALSRSMTVVLQSDKVLFMTAGNSNGMHSLFGTNIFFLFDINIHGHTAVPVHNKIALYSIRNALHIIHPSPEHCILRTAHLSAV